MRGWQFTEIHKPLTLVELPDPVPGPGEIALEVKAAGLCHSDVGYIEGVTTSSLGMIPIILGHEVAGIVTALGDGVTDFQVGDRVAVRAGLDSPGVASNGGYANMTVANTKIVAKIPEGVPFEYAAAATDAGMTSYHAVSVAGQVKAGDRVGIVGLGGLGYLGAQVALALGAKVYGVDPKPESRAAVELLKVERCVADVNELADEQLDVVIDFAGFGTTTAGAIEVVKTGGRVVQIGLGKAESTINTFNFVVKQLTMIGSVGGTREDLEEALKLIAAKKIVPLITMIGFDEIQDGIDKLTAGKVKGRLVAEVNP